MAERPIIFSGPMIRAILDGRKTQTRRVIRPVQPRDDGMWPAGRNPVPDCRYGQPGARLWVRETWCSVPRSAGGEHYHEDQAVRYRATWEKAYHARWRPSIHMPRWLSRLTLEIVSVRVERLHEISNEDARAEGALLSDAGSGWTVNGEDYADTPRAAFMWAWKLINGKRAPWNGNPWLWVIDFKRVAATPMEDTPNGRE